VEVKARKIGVAKAEGRRKKKAGKKKAEKKKEKEKPKKECKMEVRKVAEEWEIWDEEEEVAKLKEEARKQVLEKFHK